MSSIMNLDSKQLRDVAEQCRKNPPKLVNAFEEAAIAPMKKAYEDFNQENFKTLGAKAETVRKNAVEPAVETFKKIAEVLDELANQVDALGNSVQ